MVDKMDTRMLAAALVGGDPLDFALKADGSLVVIAPNGQKFKFTAEQVAQKRAASQPKGQRKAAPRTKSAAPKPPAKKPA